MGVIRQKDLPPVTAPTAGDVMSLDGTTMRGITVENFAAQLFGSTRALNTSNPINKVTITAPATGSTLTIPDGVTLTGPAASGVVMTLGNVETITGAKTFNDGKLVLAGSVSGTTILKATGAASGTLTLPAATDTLVGKATTDTLTNKTFDTAGAGNVFKINGTTISANTGTGSNVLATSPTLVTPTLGAATATSVTFSPTTGGIVGTTTNDNASAGTVGEYVESQVLQGSAVSLSTGVTANVTSISLTAGDWDVWAVVSSNPTGSTVETVFAAAITTTSATLPTNPNNGAFFQDNRSTTGTSRTQPVGMKRLSVASTTTVYLVVFMNFSASTDGAYGALCARRVR